ncbi:hypothetical protein FISHEDRAFT_73389 [Fistulina hepatica ATCC 64428]|uniref:Uncharacterized protein n=1 Tax=Fistulina hepatica ATCC 64428 TaxID=1128425 RepID=A0A0D7ACH4_9AGAR|nr:hypothetical protein FISHEDRAFT_73389 [Fistulina hepatica ATCC 64428]
MITRALPALFPRSYDPFYTAPVIPPIIPPPTVVAVDAEPIADAPISISSSSAEEEVVRGRTASPHVTSLADLATVAASLADPVVVPAIAKDGSAKDDSSSSRETSSPASRASDTTVASKFSAFGPSSGIATFGSTIAIAPFALPPL